MTPSTGTDGRSFRRARGIRALLFDRDGTLLHDVPYNAEPWRVRPLPGALEAVRLARRHGWSVGVVTNQSGVGRGLVTPEQLDAVHQRMRALFGGFDVVEWCPHAPTDGCECRKPSPVMIRRAASAIGVRPDECVVIGDRHADVLAAVAAGASAIRIGTPSYPDALAAVRTLLSAEEDDEDHHDHDDGEADVRHSLTPWPESGPAGSAPPAG